MPERTEIEKPVRELIASDIVYRPLKSFGERGVRRLEKIAKEVSVLLKEGEEVGERVFARVEKRDEEKARTLREGINAFKKKHPEYGEILERMIAEKRTRNNRYLLYGLQEGFKLGEEDYMRAMMDLGMERREAASLYPHIIAISEMLGKAGEQAQRRILVSRS
jgi:hypothetical protein